VSRPLRVALFSDSFYERNGVGTLSREFVAFAQRRNLPFCSVRCGPETAIAQTGLLTTADLKRGLKIKADKDLYIDPLLSRYRNRVWAELRNFRPDLIHITGPSDVGVLGFWISNLMSVPMVASWHTNLHEYAGRRVHKNLRFVPTLLRERAAAAAERHSLRALLAFYRLAHFVVAPNEEMVQLLHERTGRPAYRMQHGVDGNRFSPRAGSERDGTGRKLCIGWVGRLTPEKNVRAFVELERQLLAAGATDFRMLLVGDGSEMGWLRRNLAPGAELPGFLEGEALVAAFRSMDVFVFPSRTDTFGLVALEAMATGLPAVLSLEAGARIGIHDGVEGLCSGNLADDVLRLLRSPELRQSLSREARKFAAARSWDAVFDDLYHTFETGLEHPDVQLRVRKARKPR
jgi:phosphatidylinositol alpha 1,6-mannosyltransferase